MIILIQFLFYCLKYIYKVDDQITFENDLPTKKGNVEPTILIFGSSPLAIPSRTISYVKSKAKLPSNWIPWDAEIDNSCYIFFPTFISGIAC